MKLPEFKSEAEEAQWIYKNREELQNQFVQAMREGRTSQGGGLSVRERVEATRARAINIRMAPEDLNLVRRLAELKGLPSQTYIESLLHEALQREATHLE